MNTTHLPESQPTPPTRCECQHIRIEHRNAGPCRLIDCGCVRFRAERRAA